MNQKKIAVFTTSSAYILCACFLLSNCRSANSATPKTDTVVIENMKFIPAEITVSKGDTIIFLNKDIVAHDATEINKAWASPPLSMGDSWKFVAQKSDDYYCSIHLVMKGKITVK